MIYLCYMYSEGGLMNIEFMTNDYLLAWYLLFKPSFSEEMQKLKIKLYQTYGMQYMRLEKENIEILKYNNDFIPDDDTIYNIVFESDIFKQLKKETDKHRQYLMKAWDTNQKKIKSNFIVIKLKITKVNFKWQKVNRSSMNNGMNLMDMHLLI